MAMKVFVSRLWACVAPLLDSSLESQAASFLEDLRSVAAVQLQGVGHRPGETLLSTLASCLAQHAVVPQHVVLVLEDADGFQPGVLSSLVRGLAPDPTRPTRRLPLSLVLCVASPAEAFHARLPRVAARGLRLLNVHLPNPLVSLDVFLHALIVRGVLPSAPGPSALKWAMGHALAHGLSITAMAHRLTTNALAAATHRATSVLLTPLPEPLVPPPHVAVLDKLCQQVQGQSSAPGGATQAWVGVAAGTSGPPALLGLLRASAGALPATPEAWTACIEAGSEGDVSPLEACSCLWWSAAQRASALPPALLAAVLPGVDEAPSQGSEGEDTPEAVCFQCLAEDETVPGLLPGDPIQPLPQAKPSGPPRVKGRKAGSYATKQLGDFMVTPEASAVSILQTPALWPPGFLLGVDDASAVLTSDPAWHAPPTSATGAPTWPPRGKRRLLARHLFRIALHRVARHRVLRILTLLAQRSSFAVQGAAGEWEPVLCAPLACTAERRTFAETMTGTGCITQSAWFSTLSSGVRDFSVPAQCRLVRQVLQLLLQGGSPAQGHLPLEGVVPLDASIPWPVVFWRELCGGAAVLRALEQPESTAVSPTQDAPAAAPKARYASSARRRAEALKHAAAKHASPASRAHAIVWPWITAIARRWCKSLPQLPLGSVLFPGTTSSLRKALAPDVRGTVLRALADPAAYLIDIPASSDGGGAAAGVLVDHTIPDISMAFRIYQRAGKRISLTQWLAAFHHACELPQGAILDVGSFVHGAAKAKGAEAATAGDAPPSASKSGGRRRGVKRSRVGPREEHVVPAPPTKASRGEGRHTPPCGETPPLREVDAGEVHSRFVVAVRELGMLGFVRKAGSGRDDVLHKLVYNVTAW